MDSLNAAVMIDYQRMTIMQVDAAICLDSEVRICLSKELAG